MHWFWSVGACITTVYSLIISPQLCVSAGERSDCTHYHSAIKEIHPQWHDTHALHKLWSVFTRFLKASALELSLHSIFQITSLSHGVLKAPLSFMFLSPPSSVFPLSAFSSVYTSAVIYLLFCSSNVVNMCLASLHAPLICSQLRNHWRTVVDLPSSLSLIPQWLLNHRDR